MEGAMLGTSAISAYGDIESGKMTADSLNQQADNLMAQAQEAEDKGHYDAMREGFIANQKIGTSEAAYGASGVTAQSGSVLSVLQASHMNAELDRQNILHGADVRAINYENQASMNRYGGKSAILGSYWQALGALSGGAINAGSWGAKAGGARAGGGGEGAGVSAGAPEEGMAGADTGAEAAALA